MAVKCLGPSSVIWTIEYGSSEGQYVNENTTLKILMPWTAFRVTYKSCLITVEEFIIFYIKETEMRTWLF